MYCMKCGELNEDSALFCKQCGESLRPATARGAPPSQTGAPGGGPAPVAAGTIPNHLVMAILVTVLCCLPCGIVAIVYGAQVNPKVAQGDLEGALRSSRRASFWSWLGIGLGLAGILIYALVVAMSMMAFQ